MGASSRSVIIRLEVLVSMFWFLIFKGKVGMMMKSCREVWGRWGELGNRIKEEGFVFYFFGILLVLIVIEFLLWYVKWLCN